MMAKRERLDRGALTIALMTLVIALAAPLAAQTTADRLIVVTLDGVRWQEIFTGADRSLLTGRSGGVADTASALARFWRPDPSERRNALFPFLTGTLATRGALLGDSVAGSVIRVTNGKRFSYPGYNELFTGAPDDRIDSNDRIPNPNVTVVEWLASRPRFRGSVELFGSWDVFPSIFNVGRSRLPLNAQGLPFPRPGADRERMANAMTEWLPALWTSTRLDAPTMAAALEALRTRQPRVIVILLGETDEWAHERRYDLYLDAARRSDRFIRLLWETAQSLPEYRGRTSLLVATDHGRGTAADWTDHGREVAAAERIWIGMMGPAVVATSVRAVTRGTQSQFAATLAKLVGEDWQSARPNAAAALPIR